VSTTTKLALRIGIGMIVLLLAIEISLRLLLGLGSPPLVYASNKFGYAFQPNQLCRRFGHKISYNEVGLRSEKLRPQTGAAYRVLCVGGAVTNGGAPIGQTDTYPYQLERILHDRKQDAQVLNASAGGWNFGNEAGFLQDKGLFEAKIVVLEVGTRDLFQESPLNSVNGNDPNLPEHDPPTAISELADRYILPKVYRRLGIASSYEAPAVWSEHSMTSQNYQRGMETLEAMVELASQQGAKPILLLTPDKAESVRGDYRADHRKDLSDLAEGAHGRLVDLMPAWRSALSRGREIFRDDIHPNPEGNRLMAEVVAAAI
jgi:hypothetical protein